MHITTTTRRASTRLFTTHKNFMPPPSPHKYLANDYVLDDDDDEVYDACPYSPVPTVSVPDEPIRPAPSALPSSEECPAEETKGSRTERTEQSFIGYFELSMSLTSHFPAPPSPVSYLYLQSARCSCHLAGSRYCGRVSFKWATSLR